MTDQHTAHRTHQNLPLYPPGAAPRYMFTERQLREQFDLRPGGPCRAVVESQYGPAALYLITQSEIIDSQSD
jgi:hypothetical protein